VKDRPKVEDTLVLWTMDLMGPEIVDVREGLKILFFIRRECRWHEYLMVCEMDQRGWKVPPELKQRKRQLRREYMSVLEQDNAEQTAVQKTFAEAR
jgi:hypothetical protein